jgi:hypothetical protein
VNVNDDETIDRIATLLEGIAPFSRDTPRHLKWRTTEQLAVELAIPGGDVNLAHYEALLTAYENVYRERLARNLPPAARFRRAVYPDRTTALPLWGATKFHGQPWLSQPLAVRTDQPEDIPATHRVADSAPRVFLSHAALDQVLASSVAESLAAMQIGAWRFESYIKSGDNIAASVKSAITDCCCCLGLLTRESIASLWTLTELHTARALGTPCLLLVDTSDPTLVRLLQSVRFKAPNQMFDLDVCYDVDAVAELKHCYETRPRSRARIDRYPDQVKDFLATLPLYLDHLETPALAYPRVLDKWSGPVPVAGFETIRSLVYLWHKRSGDKGC